MNQFTIKNIKIENPINLLFYFGIVQFFIAILVGEALATNLWKRRKIRKTFSKEKLCSYS